MGITNATTRGVVAALVAVSLALPTAALADDGSMSANSGGGATYYETSETDSGQIALAVRRGTWLGRTVRISGTAEELAGETLSIERKRSRRGAWSPLGSVEVGDDGSFALRWKPGSTGTHRLRAIDTSPRPAGTAASTSASSVKRLTVYERVTATWYGPGFYGNRTACGQRLTRRTLGVAHKTLPCGTRVALRHEGRSIVVPVIDRGPYARGISYDLTSATARRLGAMFTSPIGAAIVSR